MIDFVKFGCPDWPASPDVLNGHPYKHIILITTILKQFFRVTNKQKQKKKSIRYNCNLFLYPTLRY